MKEQISDKRRKDIILQLLKVIKILCYFKGIKSEDMIQKYTNISDEEISSIQKIKKERDKKNEQKI